MISLFDLLGAPARKRFLLALLLSALAGASGVALLGLSGWFLTAAALAGASGAGLIFNHLYPSAGVRGLAFGRVISRYAEQLVGHDATLRLSARLRPELFAAGGRASRGFTPMPGGELAALIDDVDTVEGGFLRVLSPLAAVLASVLVALGFTVAASPLLGALTLAALLLAGWFLPVRAARQTRTAADRLAAGTEDLRARLANLVENAVELDVNGALPRLSDELADRLAAHDRDLDALERPFRRLGAVNAALGGILAFLLFGTHTNDPAGIAMAAGGALALLAAFDALGTMAKVLDAAPRAAASAERLKSRLAAPEALPIPSRAEAQEVPTPFPLTAENVVVRAAPSAPAIGPLSFEIRPGSVTFLTGPSGSGKTTLLEALMRLQPVEAGTLRYGSVEASTCRPAGVLAHMAISPQFAAFLPGTIREQFRLADPDIDDARIREGLELVELEEVIARREGGLDHPMGDELAGLSGGELRRLGLARALAAPSSILVLDEPFAGLEPPLARRIAERLTAWAATGERALIIALHDEVAVNWSPLNVQKIDLSPFHHDNLAEASAG